MSLCWDGFIAPLQGASLTLIISHDHPLLRLGRALPWDTFLTLISPDLKTSTGKLQWWRGRPLQVRIHLGIYLLQQLYNYTDRQIERLLNDNAAYRLFCGEGLVKKWHCPDHTKIEAFRSRLQPETQRQLANLLAQAAHQRGYANAAHVDIDSTVQEANIGYPSRANLLIKLGLLAKRLVKPLNALRQHTTDYLHHVDLKRIKGVAKAYFFARCKSPEHRRRGLQQLWRTVAAEVVPIFKDSYQLVVPAFTSSCQRLAHTLEQFQTRGAPFLDESHQALFEGHAPAVSHYFSFHAQDVHCFNKNKPNKPLEFGRAYQLGRLEGNFIWVAQSLNLSMPDAPSLPLLVEEHAMLFGEGTLDSLATDKGYYSHSNEALLQAKGVTEVGLQRPTRVLNAPHNPLTFEASERLYNRRSGIEALISHIKHGGQMGRSRMKSDRTTLAAGYAAVLGFNLRQWMNKLGATSETPCLAQTT